MYDDSISSQWWDKTARKVSSFLLVSADGSQTNTMRQFYLHDRMITNMKSATFASPAINLEDMSQRKQWRFSTLLKGFHQVISIKLLTPVCSRALTNWKYKNLYNWSIYQVEARYNCNYVVLVCEKLHLRQKSTGNKDSAVVCSVSTSFGCVNLSGWWMLFIFKRIYALLWMTMTFLWWSAWFVVH